MPEALLRRPITTEKHFNMRDVLRPLMRIFSVISCFVILFSYFRSTAYAFVYTIFAFDIRVFSYVLDLTLFSYLSFAYFSYPIVLSFVRLFLFSPICRYTICLVFDLLFALLFFQCIGNTRVVRTLSRASLATSFGPIRMQECDDVLRTFAKPNLQNFV